MSIEKNSPDTGEMDRSQEGVTAENEVEKNPVEGFVSALDNIAIRMRKSGLEDDAIIVEKLKAKFDKYTQEIKDKKRDLESSSKKKFPLDMLKDAPAKWRIDNRLLITQKIGEGEGSDKELDSNFSGQGETEFYRSLGILEDNEKAADLPAIYQARQKRQREKAYDFRPVKQINPNHFTIYPPTNLEGVNLRIFKDSKYLVDRTKRDHSMVEAKSISFQFDDDFLETVLAEE